jgi:hypothetical protein
MLDAALEIFKTVMFILGCGATLVVLAGTGIWLHFYRNVKRVRDGKE